MQRVPQLESSPLRGEGVGGLGVSFLFSCIMYRLSVMFLVSCNLLSLSLLVGFALGDAAGRLGRGEDVRLGAL